MDGRALRSEWLPEELHTRQDKLQELKQHLERGRGPVVVTGPPGTGKTTAARMIVEEFKAHRPSVVTAYCNTWKNRTRHQVYYRICQSASLGMVFRTGMPTEEMVRKMDEAAKEKDGIYVLDEIDQIDDERILYEFADRDQSTIFIANSNSFIKELDERTISRLTGMEEINFSRYNSDELLEILKRRAEAGLKADRYSVEALERIADASEGDGRKAVNGLRKAAQKAQDKSRDVSVDLVESVWSGVEESSKQRSLDNLNRHQEILLEIIKEEDCIQSSELYEEYSEEVSSDPDLSERNNRTLRRYLNKLVDYRLVEKTGEGPATEYCPRN